jgi:hypothetical protein
LLFPQALIGHPSQQTALCPAKLWEIAPAQAGDSLFDILFSDSGDHAASLLPEEYLLEFVR